MPLAIRWLKAQSCSSWERNLLRVTFCCVDTNAQPWLEGLRAALPQADVALWVPGAIAADYAVVWAPPQTFFDDQNALQGVLNLGPGVDAL